MLCMGEHPFYPVRMNTPYPGGGEPPKWYQQDRRPVRGAGDGGAGHQPPSAWPARVCLVPERNPIFLANAVATLDYFSGGPLQSRRGHRMGPGGVRNPGRRFRPSMGSAARVRVGDEGDVDQTGSRIPWPMGPVSGAASQSRSRRSNPIRRSSSAPAKVRIYNRSLRYTVSIADGWMPLFNSPDKQLELFAGDGQKT